MTTMVEDLRHLPDAGSWREPLVVGEGGWYDLLWSGPRDWGQIFQVLCPLRNTTQDFAGFRCSEATWEAQLSSKLQKRDDVIHWMSGYRGQLQRTADDILTVTQLFRYDTTWAHMGGRLDYSPTCCGGTHIIRGGRPTNECDAKYGKMRFYELKLLDGLARGMTAKFAVFENSRLWDKVPGKGEYAYGRFEMRGKYLNLVDIYPMTEEDKIWL